MLWAQGLRRSLTNIWQIPMMPTQSSKTMGRIRRLPIGDLLIGASPSLYFPNPMSIGTAETIKIIADIAKPSFGGNCLGGN